MDSEFKKKKKHIQTLTCIILGVITALIAAFLVYTFVTDDLHMIIFEILLGLFLFTYLIMSDVVEPLVLKQFQDLTPDRLNAYLKVLGLDAVGAAAMVYWIVQINSADGTDALIPLLVYFITARWKRKYRAIFDGIAPKDADDADDADEEQDNG